MNDIRVPLALSLLGHAVLLALLVFFVTAVPPRSLLPPTPKGIAVTFAPSVPQPAAPPPKPAAAELPPLPPAPAPPPPTPLPPLAPLPTVESPPPLPPQKPVVPRRPVPRPALRRPERPLPHREPMPTAPPQPAAPPSAYNRVPAPPAEISPGYRELLGAWIERHKRYPESARERGEEGEAVLRFVVDRSGRVVDATVVKSSGYPDLDAAVAGMMRGANLPPFPADMPQASITVTVPIRFSLAG